MNGGAKCEHSLRIHVFSTLEEATHSVHRLLPRNPFPALEGCLDSNSDVPAKQNTTGVDIEQSSLGEYDRGLQPTPYVLLNSFARTAKHLNEGQETNQTKCVPRRNLPKDL